MQLWRHPEGILAKSRSLAFPQAFPEAALRFHCGNIRHFYLVVLGAAGAQASGSTSGLVLLPLGLQDMSQELQKRAAVRLRILRFPPVFEA